jgi:adenosylmethionine-8-amino-7-oxononanoate aminotransferase
MPRTIASHHWLPFTQMAPGQAPVRTFVRANGTRLFDDAGNDVFDAISSVWTTIHGHGHPAIVAAISRQAAVLDHVTALGATHPVAEELAAALAAKTGLDRVLFAGDGASAIEAALKLALQYWRNRGQPERTRFARLVAGYHGDTIGAMSVSDVGIFKAPFEAVTFESLPYDRAADVLSRPDLAAIIVEPLVQAAAGMRLVPFEHYDALRERGGALRDRGDALRERGDALLIVDEIATGFGRTGTMFAFEQLDLRPDLLTLGKGLSGGTLALSATLAREEIFEEFSGAHADARHFFHGHSFAANPIACAAALASLELFATEGTLAHAARLGAALEAPLQRLRAHPAVREIRRAGLMCGIELVPNAVSGEGPTSGWNAARALYALGHFTRPIGDTIQLVPPLSSSSAELLAFVDALHDVLADAA